MTDIIKKLLSQNKKLTWNKEYIDYIECRDKLIKELERGEKVDYDLFRRPVSF